MQKNVWITGASGFIARHLLKHLADIDNAGTRLIGLSRSAPEKNLAFDEWLSLDLAHLASVRDAAAQFPPSQIYHLAGATPPKDDLSLWTGNTTTTLHLMLGLKLAGVSSVRILNVGSAAEYLFNETGVYDETCPVGGQSPYGNAKSMQTTIAHHCAEQFGFEAITARVFNLTGPGLPESLVLGRVCKLLHEQQPLALGRLDSERDFLDVRDTVAAFTKLMSAGQSGETYNVCSGEAISIQTAVDIATRLSGRDVEIEHRKAYSRDGDFNRSLGINAKLTQTIDWQPEITLEASLNAMLNEL